jgi:cytochrome c oxidase assembly protein subunit 15
MRPEDSKPDSAAPPASSPPAGAHYRPGPHRVALLAAALTLALLFLGGSVTSYGVGMAVPDWPTTKGENMFLYDFRNDALGVRLEHTHRLCGAAVGVATILLAGWLVVADRRRSLKVLGLVALAAVIAQGVMGGLRVTQISTLLAAFHGCFAQAFFGLMIALCVLTGRVWQTAGPARADTGRLRLWAAASLALVSGQIVVGAWVRHFKPPGALLAHMALAMVVLGIACAVAGRVRRAGPAAAVLVPSARALSITATLQVALGLLALVLMLPLGGNPRPPSLWEAMSRTAHQTNGALLLAAAVVLALRAFGHLRGVAAGESPDPDRSASEPAPRAAEALA